MSQLNWKGTSGAQVSLPRAPRLPPRPLGLHPGCGGLCPQSESIAGALTSSQVAGCVSGQAVSVGHLTLPRQSEGNGRFHVPRRQGHTGSSVVSAWMPGHLRGALPAWVGSGSGACSESVPHHSQLPRPFTLVTLGSGSQGGGTGRKSSISCVLSVAKGKSPGRPVSEPGHGAESCPDVSPSPAHLWRPPGSHLSH